MQPPPPDPNDPKLAQPPQNKKNEIVRLQSEITSEIERDAPHIARMVFGNTKDMPDVVGLSNEQLDRVYRQKYLEQDREWLQAEAKRDPLQFEKVTDRIGVVMPQDQPPTPMHPAMQAPIPEAAPPPMALPAPPVPPPAMTVQPVPQLPPIQPAAPQAAPVIYGPNGQPLAPSGAVGV